MNKLAAVQNAIEEVNKQAMFGSVLRAGQKAFTGVKNFFKAPKVVPPVTSAGGAAASASKAGLGLKRTAAAMVAPMVFTGTPTNLSGQP